MKTTAKTHCKVTSLSLLKTAFLVLICLCTSSFSYAQKNERKGFFLGIGVGPGLVAYKTSFTGFDFLSEKKTKVTFMSDFKIGYAPTDQLAIYWTSKVAWFNSDFLSEEKNLSINGFGGVGASYFLETEAPSFYFNGGIGYATWSVLNTENTNASLNTFGLGLSAGAGYEFARHWSAEANFTFGKPKDGDFTVNTTAVRFTINYLLY